MANTLRRRSFFHGFVIAAASSKLLGCGDDSETTPPQGPSTAPEDQDRVFPQGLASGDPTPSSVILWVRVEPTAEADSVSVLVEVAEDEAFSTLVLNESYDVTADSDHTLRVKLTELEAFTRYYYRFTALEVQSVVGRTKTAPAADTDTPVRFASSRDARPRAMNSARTRRRWIVSRTEASMKPDSVSPSWSTLSAASRSSGSTRSDGRVADFMAGRQCVAVAMHSTWTVHPPPHDASRVDAARAAV